MPSLVGRTLPKVWGQEDTEIKARSDVVISVELSNKLKNAGLVWDPKIGDLALDAKGKPGETGHVVDMKIGYVELVYANASRMIIRYEFLVYLPTLSDLLVELEGRGWWWNIDFGLIDENGQRKYTADISKRYAHKKAKYTANTPEEAAGQALLWVLEEEKGKME